MSDISYTHEVHDGSLQSCKKCNLPIYEGHAYELGDDRWHINCFKCSKCNSSLGCNSNFLVLGNGNLICSNCSYNCKQCGKKIDDLAILTGDQAYCSSCFKCRACKLKIEDLRYARTSKGLFCMSCHEKLVAKKKKVDMKKRQLLEKNQNLQQLQNLQSLQQNPTLDSRHLQDISNQSTPKLSNPSSKRSSANDLFLHQNRSSSSVAKDKNLPLPPPGSGPGVRDSVQLARTETSITSGSTHLSTGESPRTHEKIDRQIDLDFSIEEVNDSDDELNRREDKKQLKKEPERPLSERPISQETHPDDLILNIIDSHSQPATPSKTALAPPVDLTPRKAGTAFDQTNTNFQGKNVLILSPNQYHNNHFHNLSTPGSPNEKNDQNLTVEDQKERARSNCPSPMAHANRQARVMETGDESAPPAATPRRKPPPVAASPAQPAPMSSPPPKMPVPSTPVRDSHNETFTPRSADPRDAREPKGLGLDLDYERQKSANTTKITHTTPAITNLEETIAPEPTVSRKNTIMRTPKMLRHKRSISGGSASKFGFFKSKEEKGHARHVSDGSISNASAFTTPPLPFTSPLDPGFRETPFLDPEIQGLELELRLLKADIGQYEHQRSNLAVEVKRLQVEKAKLSDSLKLLLSTIATENLHYNNLTKEISNLEAKRKKLVETNQILMDENLKLSLKSSHSPTPGHDNGNGAMNGRSTSSVNTSMGNSNYTSLASTSSSSLVTAAPEVSDDTTETHKATRLKFWRRPKISGPVMIDGEEDVEKKGLGSFMAKSKSTNVLESYLDEAPLFSSTIQKRAEFEGERVPLIITRCLAEVEKRGLDAEGIYRISGGNSAVVAIENAFSAVGKDEKLSGRLNEALAVDINAVTSALKRYLRKLPNPLITLNVYDDFIKLSQAPNDKRLADMKLKVIDKLPSANKHTLYLLCKHLALVSSYQNVNRMGFKNLSVVFAPTIARDATGEREMADMGRRNDSTEFLLNNFESLFEGYN